MNLQMSRNSALVTSRVTIRQAAGRLFALLLLTLCPALIWAGGGSSNYYASLKVTQAGPTGAGSVYVAKTNTKPAANPGTVVKSDATTTSGGDRTFYYWTDINAGYNVIYSGKIVAGPATGATLNGSVTCKASTSADGTEPYTATATFVPVGVTAVDNTEINLTTTNPNTDYPFTVTFTTQYLKALATDLTATPAKNETTNGFTITNWGLDGNKVVATGNFNGGGSYGAANRSYSTTITLASNGTGGGTKTCTVNASFPALEYVGGTATDVFTTTSDATKTGTAEFNFNYGAEDDFPTTPAFTHTSGAGAFSVTGYTVTPDFSAGTCKVVVSYSFNPNNAAGTTVEELKITSVGGLVASVSVTAEAEAEATEDARVIKSDGTTIIYQGDWATALTKANANENCTLQLLRNVDLGSLTAYQYTTATFTLDLNGKTLSGTVNSTVKAILNTNKASRTLTIKDSKTGGKIIATGTYTNALYAVFISKGNVILESGDIEITNENTTQTTADRLYATGVYVSAGTTFTMNGGSITANRAARDAYGIYVVASATSRGKATINAGTINANANSYAYGIRGYGDIIFKGGTINANTLTGAYAFGIYVRAAASATAANGYAGTLTMSGGTINSTAKTSYAHGIYMQTAHVGTADVVTPEGTHSNQETGTLNITGGTMNVINNGSVASTNQYAYGIYLAGDYSSKSAKHIIQSIKGLKLYVEGSRYIYGIYAAAVAETNSACHQTDVILTDNDIEVYANQSVQAYAVYAVAASRTIYNTTANYSGEYACASKVTINSGTYLARTKTTNAYAVASSTRAKTTFAPDHTLGGNAEAYPTIIIKGGEFIANSGTTTARAVSSGGNTTITGGTFTANAATTTAYGIYSVAGDLNVTGAEVNAEANNTAMGVYVDCAVASITGFSYFTNATLKNLTVNATTRTGAEADGVLIANYKRNLTAATLKSDSTSNKWSTANYDLYAAIYNYGDYAVGAKCTIIGGTYTAKSATTTAYGVRLNGPAISADSDEDGTVAYAYGQLDISNAEILAQTNGTTTAYGVWTGGPTTINKCDISANTKTTTCTGVFIEAGKTTITGTTIDATGTATVRGIYVNARVAAVNGTQNVSTEFSGVAGFECIGELEATNNTVTATATSGNTAYGIYINAVKAATASGPFAGDHAIAGSAVINSGKYTATATGTTAYGIGMIAQQKQNDIFARPECHVINGKFYGSAIGGTEGSVDGNGQMGYVVLSGGYYNLNTNLSLFVEEGKNINDVLSGTPEYTEGYRYTIGSGISGAVVCRVYQGTTERGAYKTLKEALQFVNANQGTAYTIVMVGNHTLPKGNYILPAKATLVIPESLTRKSGMGTRPIRDEGVSVPKPVQFLMLTFDKGVNMTVYGGIETSANQNSAGGGQAITGAPHGNYGRLHLMAGSKITLESGSNFNCWGYCTGAGEVTAMSGSTVREGFQLGFWRGGSATYDMLSNKNTWHAFPVTDYFIQNVEAPIMFRPGSTLYGYSGVHTGFGDYTADDVKLVGTTGAMFLLDQADASADTWVKKEYDPATDRAVWTVNSGAKLGQFSFELAGYGINSADYYLPVSNNMTIYINEGEFTVTQDALLIPGAQIIISKLGKLTVSPGKRLFVMDNEDWPGFYKTDNTTFSRWYYHATYSPSWTTNPRATQYPPTTKPLPDAEIFVHGTTEGQYYTTTHGANIHSTNEDAGVVRFIAAAGAPTSIEHVVNTECNRRTLNFTTAQLKNEDTNYPYTPTAGTVAGDAYTYMDYQWVNVKENGCLLTKTDGTGTHDLAHPSDVVAVKPNTDDNAYHSEDGTRQFIYAEKSVNTAGCVWWEAEKVTSGDYAGDYMANKEQFDNYGGYYTWDASSGYWKPRTVTVTWKNYDGTTLATYTNVIYNTSPRYTGVSPKVPANTSTATYAWTGWDGPNGTFYDKNETLPRVTGNITYTAHVQETKYEYLITFKNDAGKVIHTEMFEAGTIPSCPEEKLVKASTTSQDFTFSGWNTPLVAVTGPAEYIAQFTPTPRKYTISFVDWDMTPLVDVQIPYGTVAYYPEDAEEPYRESTDAYSYEWTGWNKVLATVTKDATYVAKYKQTVIKYKVIFKSDCWGQNDGDPDCVEKIHKTTDYALGANPTAPANPARPATAQYTYTFSHWTPAIAPVEVGGATYTAVYTKTPRTYNITYKDKDNKTFTGTHGANYPTTHTYGTATNLVNPTKTGYTFEGWYSVADCSSGKITKVAADVAEAYTVFANWTPNTNTAYTVKHFKQNIDGSYNETPDDTDNLTGTTATTVTPDRKTYTGFSSPTAQTKTILADGSLVIEYKYPRLSFILKWALNGGKVTVAGTGAAVDATGNPQISLKYDAPISVPVVERTGYTFNGWEPTPAAKMPAEAATYTAQWTANTYNINYYDENGVAFTGTHGENHPTTHTYGTATALVTPEREGYTFGGWFTVSDCTSGKVTSLAATGYTDDINLYAMWTPKTYNIVYRNKDNATFTGTHAEGYPTTHTYGVATPLDSPTRTGYTFGGWFISEDCTGTALTTLGATDYTAAITLYALWTPITYNITYYDQNGAAFSGTHGENHPTTHTYGTLTALVNPTREGYTFGGWFTVSDCTSGRVTSLAATGYTDDINLYAKWTVNNYKLTWNWDGGTTTSTTHTAAGNVAYGTTLVYPDASTMNKTGYTFTGWSVDNQTMPAEPLTITAQWTINKYTITFVDGDGNTLYNPAAADNKWEYGSTPYYNGTEPTKTTTDEYTYAFNNTWSPAIANVTEDATYTAGFTATSRQMGEVLDVVDWTSSYVLLNMNGYSSPASKADWKVKYNGTTYTKANRDDKSVNAGDRTMKIAVSGLEPDQKIVISATDKNDNLESYHTYTVPHIYNASATLGATNEESVVYVHKGATLTVENDAAVKEIYVAAGAELKINAGATLSVNKLVLRTEAFASAVLTDNGKLNCTNLFYSRIVANKEAAYQIGFPFNVDLTKTTFSNGKNATHGSQYTLMEYDSQARAENGLGGNWNAVTGTTMSKNKGYVIISTSAYYYEIMFPVKASDYASRATDNAEVSLTNYSGTAKSYDQGWNFIAQPYTNVYSTTVSSEPDEVIKISVLSSDNETYYQMPLENMKPASPFYYQTTDGEKALVFKNGSLSRRAQSNEDNNSVKTQWIRLWYGTQNEMALGLNNETCDQTSIYLHPTKYSPEYERGYDVIKMSKTASIPRIYSSLECGDLAFAAVPDQMAEQAIPITVYNPASGTMNFKLDDSHSMDRLDHVYLIDTQSGSQTDLLFNDYQYQANAGTLSGRFLLKTVINHYAQPTDLEPVTEQKWAAHSANRTIIIEGIRNKDINCYNSLGQLINVVKASDATRAEFRVGVDGVYILRSADKVEKIVVK